MSLTGEILAANQKYLDEGAGVTPEEAKEIFLNCFENVKEGEVINENYYKNGELIKGCYGAAHIFMALKVTIKTGMINDMNKEAIVNALKWALKAVC